jgi:hypothetical protein
LPTKRSLLRLRESDTRQRLHGEFCGPCKGSAVPPYVTLIGSLKYFEATTSATGPAKYGSMSTWQLALNVLEGEGIRHRVMGSLPGGLINSLEDVRDNYGTKTACGVFCLWRFRRLIDVVNSGGLVTVSQQNMDLIHRQFCQRQASILLRLASDSRHPSLRLSLKTMADSWTAIVDADPSSPILQIPKTPLVDEVRKSRPELALLMAQHEQAVRAARSEATVVDGSAASRKRHFAWKAAEAKSAGSLAEVFGDIEQAPEANQATAIFKLDQ